MSDQAEPRGDQTSHGDHSHRGDPVAALPGTPAEERAQAVSLFNHAWTLLDLPERTPDQDFDLIHCVHASRWHWGRVGGPQQWAVGEWQCARAHAVLGQAESSLLHAQRCLDLCREHDLHGFVVASAHEALARAHLVAGNVAAGQAERDRAAALAADLTDAADRAVIEADLATLPLP
jgi:hypothetical protein